METDEDFMSRIISTSLSDVFRHSLNMDFRAECYRLLKVTSTKDAQDRMASLLQEIALSHTSFGPSTDKGCSDESSNSTQITDRNMVPDEECTSSNNYQLVISVHSNEEENLIDTLEQCENQSFEATGSLSDDEAQLDWEIKENLVPL